MKPLPCRRISTPRRAMTLLEVLVTTAVMVVVLGLALGIAEQTQAATRRITQTQAGLQYAQAAMEQASRTVRAAIDPRQLEGLQNQGALTTQFAEHTLTVLAFDQGTLHRITLMQRDAAADTADHKGSRQELTRETRTVAEAAGNATSAAQVDILGRIPAEGFKPSINFAYGQAVAPGLQPKFADTWSQPGLPELVQIIVRVKYDDERNRELKLQTVVLPGWVRPAQAAPSPTPAPTPTATPEAAP